MASPPSSNPTSRRYFIHTTTPLLSPKAPSPCILYLRLHGSGIDSIVLTLGKPVFLRAYLDGTKQIFDSTKGGWFGLVMRVNKSDVLDPSSEEAKRNVEANVSDVEGIESVNMIRDRADEGFEWVLKDGVEVLRWNAKLGIEDGEQGGEFGAWIVRDVGVNGHPQLFWVRKGAEVPAEGWHEVELAREWLLDEV